MICCQAIAQKCKMAIFRLQKELRADAAEVGKQRDTLEAERQQIAEQRQRDPLVAAAIMDTGLVLVCCLRRNWKVMACGLA
jgi:hypothetical protein